MVSLYYKCAKYSQPHGIIFAAPGYQVSEYQLANFFQENLVNHENLVLGYICYLQDLILNFVGELNLLLILLYPPKYRLNLVDVLENVLFLYTCTWLANGNQCWLVYDNCFKLQLATCFLVILTSFFKLNFYSIFAI